MEPFPLKAGPRARVTGGGFVGDGLRASSITICWGRRNFKSVGRGSAALTVWTEEGDDYASDELKAYAYLDDDWDKVLRATTCDEKVKLARWSAPVDLPPGRSWDITA